MRDDADGQLGLSAVLARLTDPATSTRRTEAARRRLADDPVTRALLDAGVLVLQRELGTLVPSEGGDDDEGSPRPTRFFELLSASRVCAAATVVGPLRVTPSHLRDRWTRQGDYAQDLLAHLLWRRHWDDLMHQRLRDLPAPSSAEEVPAAAAALARAHLVTSGLPVSTRLELVASALASEHPALRRSREAHFRAASQRWEPVWVRFFEGVGHRVRDGRDPASATTALAAVCEGADLRLLAANGAPAREEESVRLLVTAGLALARRTFEVDPAPSSAPSPAPTPGPARQGPPWPGPGSGDVAEVLVRLTDPVTGTRRTSAARQRLAHDQITAQLLHGGTGVLGQELGVVATGPGRRVQAAPGDHPRFFGLVSAAAVEAAGRSLPGSGPRPTAAQLRDRWPSQQDYVEDLLSYAAHRVRHVRREVLMRIRGAALQAVADRGPGVAGLEAALVAAARTVLEHVDADGHDRLRLLLTALSAARPAVGRRLDEMLEEEERGVAQMVGDVLGGAGLGLRDDVAVADLARALVALRDGVVVRALATGLSGEEGSGVVPSLARAALDIVLGSLTDTDG